MLIGAVLLWRALSVASLADPAELPDARFHGDWSSPGLNRSVKLAFANPCAWLPALPDAHDSPPGPSDLVR